MIRNIVERCAKCSGTYFRVRRIVYTSVRLQKDLYVGTISQCQQCGMLVFHPRMQIGAGVYGYDGNTAFPITDEDFYRELGDILYQESEP